MRSILASLILCLSLGCSEGFKDGADELAYLKSLSQPSVRQFHRQQELEARFAKPRALEERTKVIAAMKEAKEREARFTPGAAQATILYRKLIVDYPDTFEAEDAAKRIKEITKEGERLKVEEEMAKHVKGGRH